MPDWTQYIRQNLPLSHLRVEREAEVIEDLALQLEDAYTDALHRGLSPSQAEAAAKKHITDWPALAKQIESSRGGKESAMSALLNRAADRDIAKRGEFSFFTGLMQDIRYGLRMLRKSPGFTVVAVLTLALGIGANTAIFSMVNSVLLHPLAFRQPQQLYLIREVIPQLTKFYPTFPANFPDFAIWQRETHSFEEIALAGERDFNLTGLGSAEVVDGGKASANLFDVLGVHPALGRTFLPEEDRPGNDQVVILTDSFWRSHFHADPSALRRTIALDGSPYRIVGVLPASFHFPSGEQLGPLMAFDPHLAFFKPLGLDTKKMNLLGGFDYVAIGRLKPGVTPSEASAELNVIQAQIAKDAKQNVDLQAQLLPMEAQVVGSARRGLILLLAAVGAVLLIACVNLANLLLARMPGRKREAAIRIALGASRGRLMRQLLTESLLLGILGGTLGIGLASFGVQWLVATAPQTIPRLSEVRLDGRALLFASILSILTAAFFGILPARRATRSEPQEALKSSGAATTENRQTRRLREGLIALEVGMSTVLLILAGLLTSSLVHLLRVNTGFNVEHILVADIELPPQSYSREGTTLNFYDKALAGMRAIPGVVSAAWVSRLPLEGQMQVSDVALPGMDQKSAPLANYRTVSPDYFATMHIPLIEGRDFRDADRGRFVVIVSKDLAMRFWPGQSAVGKQVLMDWSHQHLAQVIGVAGDIRTVGLDTAPLLMVYCVPGPNDDPNAPHAASIVLWTAMDPAGAETTARNVIQNIDADVPVTALRPMTDVVSQSVDTRRFQMSLALGFACGALLLASLGIFGVVAYSVEQRRHELGIRAALGAQFSDLRGMVLRKGMAPVLAGLAAGIIAALFCGRLIAGFLFGVSALDVPTVACVASVVIVIALLACYIPARRAMKVDPMVALRYE